MNSENLTLDVNLIDEIQYISNATELSKEQVVEQLVKIYGKVFINKITGKSAKEAFSFRVDQETYNKLTEKKVSHVITNILIDFFDQDNYEDLIPTENQEKIALNCRKTFYLPSYLIQKLMILASEKNISKSTLLRLILLKYL